MNHKINQAKSAFCLLSWLFLLPATSLQVSAHTGWFSIHTGWDSAHIGEKDKKNGHISGKVTTNDGKAAASVSVTVKNTTKATLTEENGSFLINGMKPGTYQLEVSLIGYANALQTVTVEEGKTIRVDIVLQLSGQQLEEVTIKSGGRPYNTRQISPTLRLNESLLVAPQNIQV
ncbi:carboxypeptidase-like regulatory domain-containing protein, partial [Flavitalea flava]